MSVISPLLGFLNSNATKTAITIFSLFFGVIQYLRKREIKHLIAIEAAELHKNVGKSLGAIQAAKTNIQERDVLIGNAEGLNQAMLAESAKLFCTLRNTTIDDIDGLIEEGQLIEKYKEFYYTFSKRRKGTIRKIKKWFCHLY